MKLLMVYPLFPDTFWSFKNALKFINRKASSPPLGLLTVAAMVPQDWDIRLIDMNTRDLRESDLHWADLVFVGAMVVQRDSAKKVIEWAHGLGKTIVAGGPLFTGEHEKFDLVDHFVLNEAEITLPPFLADYAAGKAQRVYATSEYPALDHTPVPRWDLIDPSAYDSLSIQFTRGCPFNCDFCNITALMGHQVRYKTTAQVIAELTAMTDIGWKRNVFFVDDNFIGNKKVLKQELLPAIIEWRKQHPSITFITEASINLSDDEELMRMMTEAGFKSVFVGIETPDEASLAECQKNQNKGRDLVASVRKLHQHGLQVMGGFIVGFDSDTSSIFKRQVDFIQNAGVVTAMVGLLQAPYGTRLYERMQSEGRLTDEMSGDNVDGSTNIIPRMDLHELRAGYQEILDQIYSPELFYKRVRQFLSDYNLKVQSVDVSLEEIKAFFRSVWLLGIRGPERLEYWKLFFWTLFRDARKFPLAITFAIYGYHFRKVSEANAKALSAG